MKKFPASTAKSYQQTPFFQSGLSLATEQNYTQAIEHFSRAFRATPHPDILSNIGFCFRKMGMDATARTYYERALELDPLSESTIVNLSSLLCDEGEFEPAEKLLRKALAHSPDAFNVLFNLFSVLTKSAQWEEALLVGKQALSLNPDSTFLRSNYAQLLLVCGDINKGFQEYENRFSTHDVSLVLNGNTLQRPLWQGEPLRGKTLLAITEQGVGDTFMFLRFAAQVKAQGGRFIVTCHDSLKRMLQQQPFIDGPVCTGDKTPAFDYHIPLMSLAHRFKPQLEHVGDSIPYLQAAPQLTAHWQGPIETHAAGQLKVGLVWSGSPSFAGDKVRSPGFAAIQPMLNAEGCHFFALQMGPGREPLTHWQAPANFTDLGLDISDFADTAAIIANLDLVVTSCTSVAHLAGTMGKPVWVMTSIAPYWCWLTRSNTTPWYPSARLFRQKEAFVWEDVVQNITAALSALSPQKTAFQEITEFNYSPPVEKHPDQCYGITWTLTEIHGWGLVGVHTAAHLIQQKRPPLLMAEPLWSSVRPDMRHRLQELDSPYQRFATVDAQRQGRTIKLTGIDVLHGLGNGMMPSTLHWQGRRNIGVIAFEDTLMDAGFRQRGAAFDFIVTHSNYNRNLLLEAGFNDVRMAWQGVDPTEMELPERSQRFKGRFVIFSGGKLEFRKGQDLVLAAFKRFHDRHPDAVLAVAWHSNWPEAARSMEYSRHCPALPQINASTGRLDLHRWASEFGLPASAFVDLGFLDRPSLPTALADVDVALFPNRCEGATNLVAMEAMAAGIPCILSANTGHLDLMTEPDVCFSLEQQTALKDPLGQYRGWGESDINEIVAQLEAVYTHYAAAKQRGQNARNFLLRARTWQHFAEAFIRECDR